MAEYINKSAIVAEIDAKRDKIRKRILSTPLTGQERAVDTLIYDILGRIKDLLDTLEVKGVVDHDDSDLDIVISELGVEPYSRYFQMYKEALYKTVDKYLDKKRNSHDTQGTG